MIARITDAITQSQLYDIVDSIRNESGEIIIGDLLKIKGYISRVISINDVVSPKTFTKDFNTIYKLNEFEQQKNKIFEELQDEIKDNLEVLQVFNEWLNTGAKVPLYTINVYKNRKPSSILLNAYNDIKSEDIGNRLITLLKEYNIEIDEHL